jgi:hypothetical protein
MLGHLVEEFFYIFYDVQPLKICTTPWARNFFYDAPMNYLAMDISATNEPLNSQSN